MLRASLLAPWGGFLVSFAALACCQAGTGLVGSSPSGVCRSTDGPTGANFIPGKFWEQEAEDRRYREDLVGALEAYKHAAYYGNRDALYDIAMMYLKGARHVGIDTALGMAWLRLGAQYNHALSAAALRKLEPALTDAERQRSLGEFDRLADKYGISVTRDRVMKTYQLERGHILFADWVCRDGMAVARDVYVAEIAQEFTDYVSTMFGTVIVGPLEPVTTPGGRK